MVIAEAPTRPASAPAAPAEPAATPKVRVLTVNTHKGFTFFNRRFILHELREAVRSVGADVVFLQEVLGTHAHHSARWPGWPEAPHYEFLADEIWPEFAYGRNAVYPHGHHGNAVLSKYPIEHYENLDVSIAGPEKRGLLHCVLRLPNGNGKLHAICVHLGLQERHRRKQLQLLCQLMQREIPADAPVVVAGDFNDWRVRAHTILAREGLREVFQHAHGSSARSFPAPFPLLQLDRIYVRNATVHAPIALPRKPWAHLSDHAPLAAEISL
ncbi:endonuclease/exonuclease/phosphatase family protein [Aquincola sp. MAHUQ-54]|uniref:Endonuclease/exonuclease/phosphatase family protein n=1 Tax=Aquincola agrisoli TaxID=3119538 RepID=A0AAW9Q221_9BURK